MGGEANMAGARDLSVRLIAPLHGSQRITQTVPTHVFFIPEATAAAATLGDGRAKPEQPKVLPPSVVYSLLYSLRAM